MKKYVIILLAFVATLFVSCNNVIEPLDNNSQAPAAEGKTITFSATIDVPQTKASLDGLNIKWSDGDYIGVATDNSATIVAYPVSNISEDGLSCSLQVNAVEGATTYYAVFRGSLGADGDSSKEVAPNDFSGITFNTTTKTFSGLTVGNQQVNSGSISSHIWYTHGFPLTMAGKSSSDNVLIMKPCLALVKVQIAEESVPADNFVISETYTSTSNIGHEFSYSAVRGFNFYQKGSSTIYSSGNFTVQIGDDGGLTVVSDNTKEYRQISQSTKLAANTPYYMCVIPGGNVTSFKFDFLGYSDNTGALSWDAVYTMTKSGITSVKPGDYYDLGTLNPLGRKKAKNEATADAEDEAAASYVPAITIDGNLSDWNPETNSELTSGTNYIAVTSTGNYKEFKVAYDSRYIYFYSRRNYNEALWTDDGYYYFYFDWGGDNSDELVFYLRPFTKNSVGAFETTMSSNITVNGKGISGFTATGAGAYSTTDIETEIRILRSDLGIATNDEIIFGSHGNKSASRVNMTDVLKF